MIEIELSLQGRAEFHSRWSPVKNSAGRGGRRSLRRPSPGSVIGKLIRNYGQNIHSNLHTSNKNQFLKSAFYRFSFKISLFGGTELIFT